MKKIYTLLVSMMMLVATTVNAQPMSYNAMRNNARFLTDRMAYTLGVTDPYLIDDMYRINYDYICGVNDYLDDVALGYRYDDYMSVCEYRDYALRNLLGDLLWNRLMGYDYYYRPIIFENYGWRFSIYAFDNYRSHFYYNPPRYFDAYRGGHFFGGMRPGVARGARPVDYHGGFRDGRRDGMVTGHVQGFRGNGGPRGGVDRGAGMRNGGNGFGVQNNRQGMDRGNRNNFNHNDNMNRNGNVNVNRNENVNVNRNENVNVNRNDNMNRNGNVNVNHGDNMNRGGQGNVNRGDNMNRGGQGNMNRGANMNSGNRNGFNGGGAPSNAGSRSVSAPTRSGNVGGGARGNVGGGAHGGGAAGARVGGGRR